MGPLNAHLCPQARILCHSMRAVSKKCRSIVQAVFARIMSSGRYYCDAPKVSGREDLQAFAFATIPWKSAVGHASSRCSGDELTAALYRTTLLLPVAFHSASPHRPAHRPST